ncbi:hypothetical protein Cni_G20280 [Canna indica]|uniref:Uncharacterized protein n=1 Tax=Canna indica TaxID=4628 RepID=A0AAQ3KM87_9LILI|nr:hypothetical protein Cni_G20280 [Canna indica]
MKFGLKPGHFADHIALTKPKDMIELQEKATRFIDMEELQEAKKANRQNLKAIIEDRKSKRADRKREHHNRHKQNNGRGPRSPLRPNAQYERNTPFNTRKETILRDIYNLKLLKYPANAGKQKMSPNVDMNKKYAFHDTYGHTTEDCIVLGDQLEELVYARHLDSWQTSPSAGWRRRLPSTTDRFKEMHACSKELPDDYLVCLVGDMITEEALPTYQIFFNTFDGVRDETGMSATSLARWMRAWI